MTTGSPEGSAVRRVRRRVDPHAYEEKGKGRGREKKDLDAKTTDPLHLLHSPGVFIKPSKWLAFICSCNVSVKPAGSGEMIDVRSIPFATRGAIDGPIRAEGRREAREKKRTSSIRETFLMKKKEREEEKEMAHEERGDIGRERLVHPGRSIPKDVLMVLEIENAPGQPKWVWLPSRVPIVSVGWNSVTKWRV